tara:strand:+ start:623 stop:778 length:156 start_codon:yes stop_codon:yes gene_type:complete
MAKNDTVKAVIYIDDVMELSHEEIYEKFSKAIKENKINHFEIKTNDKPLDE